MIISDITITNHGYLFYDRKYAVIIISQSNKTVLGTCNIPIALLFYLKLTLRKIKWWTLIIIKKVICLIKKIYILVLKYFISYFYL